MGALRGARKGFRAAGGQGRIAHVSPDRPLCTAGNEPSPERSCQPARRGAAGRTPRNSRPRGLFAVSWRDYVSTNGSIPVRPLTYDAANNTYLPVGP